MTKILLTILTAFALGQTGFAVQPKGADQEACDILLAKSSDESIPPEVFTLTDAITDFGLATQLAVSKMPEFANQDITTSPFSLFSAFGLLLTSAEGETSDQLASMLKLKTDFDKNRFASAYRRLRSHLMTLDAKGNVLEFGNGLYADERFQLNDDYIGDIQHSLGAVVQTLNFGDQSSLKKINDDIAGLTHGKIQDLLKTLPPLSVLINAGYFKADWHFMFEKENTVEGHKFAAADGSAHTVPMMFHRKKMFPYYDGGSFEMVSLAYQGGEFTADIIVPRLVIGLNSSVALEQLMSKFTGENYRKWLSQLREQKLSALGLPRFEVDLQMDLSDYFKQQAPLAFGPSGEFQRMGNPSPWADQVIHASKLLFDEQGSEGAFATAITTRSISRDPSVIADHPFLVVIRETASNTPIFVTSVRKPQAFAGRSENTASASAPENEPPFAGR